MKTSSFASGNSYSTWNTLLTVRHLCNRPGGFCAAKLKTTGDLRVRWAARRQHAILVHAFGPACLEVLVQQASKSTGIWASLYYETNYKEKGNKLKNDNYKKKKKLGPY